MAAAVSALNGTVEKLKGVYNLAVQQLPDPDKTLGDPGKDPTAAAVNDSLLPAIGKFLNGVHSLVTVTGQAGDGVGTMVHGFNDTEEENAEAIRPPSSDPA
jgi:hypothetical protein